VIFFASVLGARSGSRLRHQELNGDYPGPVFMNKHGKPRRLSAPLTPAVAAKQHHLKNNDCSPRLQKTSILGLIQNFSHGSLRFRPRAARAFTTLFFGIYGQCSILEFECKFLDLILLLAWGDPIKARSCRTVPNHLAFWKRNDRGWLIKRTRLRIPAKSTREASAQLRFNTKGVVLLKAGAE
jgi:hypothetical protein